LPTTKITLKTFSKASWARLEIKPNKNIRKPKQEGERVVGNSQVFVAKPASTYPRK
jgi:hypothetical protein